MIPTFPSWFKQRQGRAESADDGKVLRLTAPNQGEAFISISQTDQGAWLASLRRNLDNSEEVKTDPVFANPQEAWEAAFELYRTHVVT